MEVVAEKRGLLRENFAKLLGLFRKMPFEFFILACNSNIIVPATTVTSFVSSQLF
jgi:hypothetical protein